MKNIDFYFVDNINFHKRNFENFITFVEENYSYHYNTAFPMLKKSFGKYYRNNIQGLTNFENIEKQINSIKKEELPIFNFKGYNLWNIVSAELKSYITPKIYEDLLDKGIKYDKFDPLELLEKYDFEDESINKAVLYNLIVGAFWIEYWAKEFKKYEIKNLCVFGGTSIYSRAATLVAQWNRINVISFEGTFIKKYHYADNASGIITNNHKYADRSNWVQLEGVSLLGSQDNWLKKEMDSRTNLNVVQPKAVGKTEIYNKYNIPSDKRIILLIGQVINDYSVTKDLQSFSSTIDFYLETIKAVQKLKGYHLFIKLHPWENYKQNSSPNLSKRILEQHLEQYNFKNYTIDYEVNIDSIIDVAEFGVTSCSQAGLEMLYSGKRVVQVGHAYYGFKGWTIDVTQRGFLEKALELGTENSSLNTIEITEVKKYIYNLLTRECFIRSGDDDKFLTKFNNVAKLDSKQEIFNIGHKVNKRELESKDLEENPYIKKIQKGIKNPKKAMKILSKKTKYYGGLYLAKVTGKKVINMVMGEDIPSKIFSDMLARFRQTLKSGYYIVVSAKPIKEADVYHYWRPNLSVNNIVSPAVATVHHDFDRDSESLSLRHYLESYQKSDLILCLNHNQKDRLIEYVDKEIKVIPHGYDTLFDPKQNYKKVINKENKLVIGFSSRRYGRLVKGEDTLYKIIENLKDENVKFIFIGQGRLKEHEFCNSMGVASKVYEKIDYSEYPGLYSKMDLFLITSKAEGGPASLPEAMASGLPIVSTPCGFVPDLVVNGKSGFIVDYDDADAFVSSIRKFLKNPILLEQMGREALNAKNLLSWEEIIRLYANEYDELLKKSVVHPN